MSIGLGADLMIKQETVYGTAVTPDVAQDFISEGFAQSGEGVLMPKTCNGTRSLKVVLPGPYKIGGSLELLAKMEGVIPWLMKGLFGQVSTTDLTGGAYRHTFTPSNSSTPISFTVYVDKEAGQFLFPGTVVSGITIGASVEKEVTISADMMSQKVQSTTALEATYSDVRELIWSDAVVTLNGVSNLDVENMSFTISQDIEMVPTHNGTRFIKRAVSKGFNVSGEFNIEFNDMTEVRRLWGATDATSPQNTVLEGTLNVAWTSPDEIGSSGQYYALDLDFPAIFYTKGDPPVPAPDARIMQAIGFVAKLDSEAGYDVRARITNGVASYA